MISEINLIPANASVTVARRPMKAVIRMVIVRVVYTVELGLWSGEQDCVKVRILLNHSNGNEVAS